jgi:hypothetical protein
VVEKGILLRQCFWRYARILRETIRFSVGSKVNTRAKNIPVIMKNFGVSRMIKSKLIENVQGRQKFVCFLGKLRLVLQRKFELWIFRYLYNFLAVL